MNPVVEKQESADVDVGNVISLNPEEGSVVEVGSDVTVAVSIGEGTAYADVPNVIGMSEETAVSAVKAVNLIPSVQYDYSADARVGIGEVFEISPQAGQSVQQGSIITLKVLTEEPQTDTQSEDTNTETTDTSTETSASSGTWATNANLKIGEPDNYEGQPVRLRLVQGSDDAQGGTTILQDQPLTFDENGEYAVGQITGQSGESTGTLYFDVQDDSGNYTTIWSYPLEFSQQ